jgi:predicted Fe-Mo cluster-binding NifX family protein
MRKKIAIPVDASGVLDAHFGHCKFFILIKTHDERVVSEEIVVPPPHEPGLLPRWLAERDVTDIIAGGMGQKAIQLFNQNGISALVGAPQIPARQLAEEFLDGTLSLSGNYCDH